MRADPLVKAVLERFPGAEIVAVREQKDAAAESPPADDSLPPADDEGAYGADWARDND